MSSTTQKHVYQRYSTYGSATRSWARSAIVVHVATGPRAGSNAVVWTPDAEQPPDGQTLAVLEDPLHPGYAELPGKPLVQSDSWIVLVIFASVVGATDLFMIIGVARRVVRAAGQRRRGQIRRD